MPEPKTIHIYENCIFVRAYKVAGASINAAICEQMDRVKVIDYKDYHKEGLMSWIEGQLYGRFLFTFVRNPWDRFISLCFFSQLDPDFVVDNWKELNQTPEFRAHTLPLHIHRELCGKSVDFIGRFESLQRDYDKLCSYLGIIPKTLPHLHMTQRVAYERMCSPKVRDFIAQEYKKDIELYGYEY